MKRTALFLHIMIISIRILNAQSFVGLENGIEIQYDNILLEQAMFSKKHLAADDNVKYSLDDVRYYQNHDGYFLKRVKKSGKYEFMKRELIGEIELYGVTKTTTSFDQNTGMITSSSAKLNFYRKGDGSIKKVNSKNLKLDLTGCDACLQEVKKGNSMATLSALVFTAGLGIFIGSAASDMGSVSDPGESMSVPVGVIIGGTLCASSMLFSGPKRKHFRNAIKIYNDRH